VSVSAQWAARSAQETAGSWQRAARTGGGAFCALRAANCALKPRARDQLNP